MFFASKTGRPITGDEASSFSSNFRSLPDNTTCDAMIKSFRINNYLGEDYYQIIWQIVNGDFEGSDVKQRITHDDQDANRAERALNMLMRVLVLCEAKIDYETAPQNEDLAMLHGKILSIKIGNGIIQGEDRTWVREVHKAGVLPVSTGQIKVSTKEPNKPSQQNSPVDSAFSRNQPVSNNALENDDIPF